MNVPSWLLVVPVALPLAGAAATLRLRRPALVRATSATVVAGLLAVAALLLASADGDTVLVHRLGDWPVPAAIVLVGDRLAALLLFLTAVVAVFVTWQGAGSTDHEGPHFHPVLLVQLAGLDAAFLAGDLFNLFVAFELLLIASYALLVHGGTRARVRAANRYVVLNLAGSALFLVGVGVLYAVAGTLNLADLAVRLGAVPAADAAIARGAVAVLCVVFALKAALVPVSAWLPGTYAAAAASVAALFSLMTKVGLVALLRVALLLDVPLAGPFGPAGASTWLLPAALVTVVIGGVGALSGEALPRLTGHLVLVSVGTTLAGLVTWEAAGMAGALLYLVQSTLAIALLFLVSGLVHTRTDAPAATGLLFVGGAMALAGMPPLPGFVAKAHLLAAIAPTGAGGWVWGVVLSAGAVAVIALSRTGIALFWTRRTVEVAADADGNASEESAGDGHGMPSRRPSLAPAAALLALLALGSALAEPVATYASRTADQLLARTSYVDAVRSATGAR